MKQKAKESYQENVGRPKKSPQNSAPISKVDTRAEVAKEAGVSHDTLAKAKKLMAKAPEKVNP